MYFSRVSLLLALTISPFVTSKQPSAPSPIPARLRKLPWGQLNFLHTTDTHGWHGGHLAEPQYSADWGDYISFAHHLHRRADAEGTDLLLIDTGDRVEGNGLYDASKPPGKYTFDIVKAQHIDVVTSGNHELYINTTARREWDEVVPDFRESYLASNIDIYSPERDAYVPLAARFRKFRTRNQKISIVAFGFLFDFTGNANNTIVQAVEDTVKEEWFQDAIREKDVDLFLVAGHVPVRDTPEFDAVYKAIREVKWDIPIVFFGGHTHIRDYRKWEGNAWGIESGRYMETIGFVSISGLSSSSKTNTIGEEEIDTMKKRPTYERMYIDNNLFSLQHHSSTNKSTFHTSLGLEISRNITRARSHLNLDKTFGCAPHSLYLTRAPYPSNSSLLTWLEKHVLPWAFTFDNSTSNPAIVITNSGALRFDIFKGPFTADSSYLLSPFLSSFRVIRGVDIELAIKVLDLLNQQGEVLRQSDAVSRRSSVQELKAKAPVRDDNLWDGDDDFQHVHSEGQMPLLASSNEPDHHKDDKQLIPGYTTSDDAGKEGDDTIHERIKFYRVPNCIAADIGFSSDDTETSPITVDLVYNEFIQSWILLALGFLGAEYSSADTEVALNGRSMTSVINGWVEENWDCDGH